ncbi:STAS domain-containing protein [Geodermatophilus obscurus]|jgi:anti-anti-sigma regulatory factor|uniref:STAS domain-containing protein n=1 Tax=Geodermatophilus obscurus TaxID=1861 RepID=A0A1I5C6Q3_9ACTN|nr:STAS domain-containing protein [Geodermatophilus obscurus]SFN82617.1 STAS domain-containing protein [Geodermatophilus obscurus]
MTTAGSPSRDAAPRTEVVVPRVGPIRVSGHLTRQGADLVRGTVETARRTGSPVVVVDLAGVRAADDAGLDALHTLRDTLSGRGTRLLLRNEPGVTPA